MQLLRGSDEPNQDRYDFFTAQVLFWLLGATDGHAKNYSLALSAQGRFRMTPLYDVLTLQPCLDDKKLARKSFKMAMRVGHSNQYNVERILGRHFVDTGLLSGLSRELVDRVFDDVRNTIEANMPSVFDALPDGFSMDLVESISAGVGRRIGHLTMS